MNEYDESIVKEFLIESYENLEQIERDLVALEKNPISHELLAGIYRSIHTIKGSSSFLGLSKLESIAHSGENLLSHLRDGRLILNSEITNALLMVIDAIRKILLNIETQRNEGETDYAQMLKALARLQEEGSPVGELPMPTSETVPEAKVDTLSIFESKIRIDVRLLNNLMDLAGELVLARNQILQFAATQEDTAFVAVAQRLNLITSELQEEVMKTRMRPISTVWNRYPRMVRDLATTGGKQVRIELQGAETGLDRSIIEAIADPLTHLVRNAIDHGLETPEERLAAGKPAEGRLFLQAFHEGGQVNIEVSDNGKGVDPERIKQKAHQSGLITTDQLITMSNQEILNLIFLPGFSTAKEVTHISGRGVGMDVVKTNIDKIGGMVDVHSKLGQGTTIKIKIPLTLAIIPALIVTCGGSRYAIPQVNLLELVRLEGAQARQGIELVQEAPVYRLRGKLLPLIYLKHELQVNEEVLPTKARRLKEDVVNIVVLQADNHQFGLIVDAIKDTQEIVVKPLGKQVKGIACFSGATIMGDGKVALILDVLNLAQRAHVISASAEAEQALVEQPGQTEQPIDNRQMMLLFRCSEMGRAAIPLSMVTRLEEFDCAVIERSGNRDMVQYRDQLLPLINLSTLFAQNYRGSGSEGTNGSVAKNGTIQVVVYSTGNRNIGLVVEHILDIVQESLEVKYPASRDDILFITVIQGQVTQVLDAERIVRTAFPTFFEEPVAT